LYHYPTPLKKKLIGFGQIRWVSLGKVTGAGAPFAPLGYATDDRNNVFAKSNLATHSGGLRDPLVGRDPQFEKPCFTMINS